MTCNLLQTTLRNSSLHFVLRRHSIKFNSVTILRYCIHLLTTYTLISDISVTVCEGNNIEKNIGLGAILFCELNRRYGGQIARRFHTVRA